MRTFRPAAALIVAASLGGPIAAQAAALEPLSIATAGGPRTFQVEVMHTDKDRERGLMFRRHLDPDKGMLFDFKAAAPVMMWMKNTYIPLDMVFIGADGRVISTAENAKPLSLDVIPSKGDALGVLEVNGGTVARLAIHPGDKVTNAMFPP